MSESSKPESSETGQTGTPSRRLPDGTVTFLMTDVEGSTRLWERYPQQMDIAIQRHNALAADTIQQAGGVLLKERGEGDSLFAVFARAQDALNAVCRLQTLFQRETWSIAPESLRVRMALHTGEANLRERDYLGGAVNRCARVRAVGHGGQILLTWATYDFVRETLPEGVRLLDLGQQRLRDLTQPEIIYQVCHPDLPSTFPALRSLNLLPNNLPRQLTTFVERENELAEVKALLGTTPLLTLTGTGGVGKTRLAQQIAADLLDQYEQGVWLTDFAPLSDPALIPQTIQNALPREESSGVANGDPLNELASRLRDKSLLLILDNCEHLIEACAHTVETLLQACPNLQILATSREPLKIGGEKVWRVPSLSHPVKKRKEWDVAQLMQYEAVRLFVERAGVALPGFTMTPKNAPAIAEICRRLDGIPFAIELAAARVRGLTPQQITTLLSDRFSDMPGSRTAPPRHQTLRALMQWSHELLTPVERILLRRLTVFTGGCSLEAVEHICTDAATGAETRGAFSPPSERIVEADVMDLLVRLIEKSLIVQEVAEDGTVRYRMLETVRQFEQTKLTEAGESETLRDRHGSYFVEFAENAEPHLQQADQKEWLDRLEREHDNLRAALAWTLGEARLRLAGVLQRFWLMRNYAQEGLGWLQSALSHAENAPPSLAAKAWNGMGVLAWSLGDYPNAIHYFEQSLGALSAEERPAETARALTNLGIVTSAQGDYPKARHYYEQALTLYRSLGASNYVAMVLSNLGGTLMDQGEYEAAEAVLSECLPLQRETGSESSVAVVLQNLGKIAQKRGDRARVYTLLSECLRIGYDIRNSRDIAATLATLGMLAAEQQDYRGAARWFGAVEAACTAAGAPLPPLERAEYESSVAVVQAALGDRFTTEAEVGSAYTPEQLLHELAVMAKG